MVELFIIAGDPSADLHGANLILSIKKHFPRTKIVCLGGKRMKLYADEFLFDLVELSVFGLNDAIKNYFLFTKIFNTIVLPYLNKNKPDAVIPMDFYGFNYHVCRNAKLKNIPVFYYISPQVWASRQGRIAKLTEHINKMMVILPFEEEIYKRAGIPTVFVGHPLLDLIQEKIVSDIEKPPLTPVCGFFPGSRKNNIIRHLPLFTKIGNLILKKVPLTKFVLFQSVDVPDDFLQKLVSKQKLDIEIKKNVGYEERAKITIAISCSGTNTLENALLGLPTIIVYKTNWLFYLVARAVIKIPHIGLANIIAGNKFMPEFIQHRALPQPIAYIAVNWLQNFQYRKRLSEALIKIRHKLGASDVSKRVAYEIFNGIKKDEK